MHLHLLNTVFNQPPGAPRALRAEPLDGRHAALMFGWLQSPQVYEWINLTPPASAAALAERWQRAARRPLAWGDDPLQLAWALLRPGDGLGLGIVDVDITPQGVVANVGYRFNPWLAGRGWAQAGVAALCAHLDRLGLCEQHATVTLGNRASCRVLQGCGFVPSGLLPANDTLRGVPVDDLAFVRHGRRPGA